MFPIWYLLDPSFEFVKRKNKKSFCKTWRAFYPENKQKKRFARAAFSANMLLP
jgi:hypothetical protein